MNHPTEPGGDISNARHAPSPGAPPAPCHRAWWILYVALGISLLSMLMVGGTRWMAGPQPEARAEAWMAYFHLTAPALWPAGTPARHPETMHPGVPLNCCAGLESRR